MLFVPCSVGRQRNPLALAPKKSVALQARQALPTVAPVPSAGRADAAAQGASSEVVVQSDVIIYG